MQRWVVLAVLGSLALAACGGDDDELEQLLRERTGVFFHNQLIDDSGSGTEQADTTVDLIRGNNLSAPMIEGHPYSTTEQDGVGFKLDADSEKVLFDVNTSTATLVDDASFTLAAGANYTFLLSGKLAGAGEQAPRLKAFRQTTASVAPSQVRVRFIHALANDSSETVSVSVEGDTLVSALGYTGATAYFSGTPSLSGQLSAMVKVGNDASVLRTCSITTGNSYDVIIAHPAPDSTGIAVFCQKLAS